MPSRQSLSRYKRQVSETDDHPLTVVCLRYGKPADDRMYLLNKIVAEDSAIHALQDLSTNTHPSQKINS